MLPMSGHSARTEQSTGGTMRISLSKRSAGAAAAAAVAVTSLTLVPTDADASARGCTGGGVYYCVDVQGSGNKVETVKVEFGVGPRVATSGYYKIWLPDGTTRTSGQYGYHNESYFHSQSWSHTWAFHRNFPSGKLCGQFISAKYSTSRACETVHP